jgi:hypothetical protein
MPNELVINSIYKLQFMYIGVSFSNLTLLIVIRQETAQVKYRSERLLGWDVGC